jgi:predicted ArsR family transcriptional regulator
MDLFSQKDALELLEATRAQLIERFRKLFMDRLRGGPCAVSDVADELPIPPDIDRRFLGAVHLKPLKEKLIVFVEYRKSTRPECHGRPVAIWKLTEKGLNCGQDQSRSG